MSMYRPICWELQFRVEALEWASETRFIFDLQGYQKQCYSVQRQAQIQRFTPISEVKWGTHTRKGRKKY